MRQSGIGWGVWRSVKWWHGGGGVPMLAPNTELVHTGLAKLQRGNLEINTWPVSRAICAGV